MEGRTYRYFKGPDAPLYPFGYGLSYASFKYSSLVITPSVVHTPVNITIRTNVSNVGNYTSDEVCLVSECIMYNDNKDDINQTDTSIASYNFLEPAMLVTSVKASLTEMYLEAF